VIGGVELGIITWSQSGKCASKGKFELN